MILCVSMLVGIALTIPINKSTRMISAAIEDWQQIDKLPPIRISIIKQMTTIIDDFLVKIKDFLDGVKDMGN
jgi:hypothetical protein